MIVKNLYENNKVVEKVKPQTNKTLQKFQENKTHILRTKVALIDENTFCASEFLIKIDE